MGLLTEEHGNDFFDTGYLKADLKGRSIRGGAVTVFAQIGGSFLRLGSTVVLARLLTPEDYGLIAMVTVVTGFVAMFKDMGLSMATVQKAEINHGQVSTLFWVNVAISLVIMLLTAAIAPAVAWFYCEPRLTVITLALAGLFILGGLTIQHQALLRRQMRFGALAAIQIISLLVGVFTAIISAWYGAKYWALVLMQLAGAVTNVAGTWFVCGWWPSLPRRGTGVRSMLVFGGNLTGFNFVNYFARNMDNVLIGKFWGTNQLGLYNKAYNLLLLPIRQIKNPLSSVVIPALSCLQEEPERYRNYYLNTVSIIAFITMPLVMFMIVMSEEIILLMLGEQWVNASKIFAILGVSALIQPIYHTQGWLHVSAGRTDRMFRWGLFASAVIVISFLIGIPFGAKGVAICYTVVTYIIAGPCLWYAGQPMGLKLLHIISVIWKQFASAVLAGLICLYVLDVVYLASSPVLKIVIGFVITGGTYLCSTLALYRNASPLLQLYNLVRKK